MGIRLRPDAIRVAPEQIGSSDASLLTHLHLVDKSSYMYDDRGVSGNGLVLVIRVVGRGQYADKRARAGRWIAGGAGRREPAAGDRDRKVWSGR